MEIKLFKGQYHYLSNFAPAPTFYDGELYPTSEHAFVAAKSQDPEVRFKVLTLKTPYDAKRYGRTIPLRPRWDQIRVGVMTTIVLAKFLQNKDLAIKLAATGDAYLEEGSPRDQFWGVTPDGVGENNLGKILMMVRTVLQGKYVPMS